MSLENRNENRYVKNSIDYSSYGCGEEMDMLSDSDCLDLLDDCIEEDEIQKDLLSGDVDVDELAMLGFFNEFALMDIGIGEFIREIYFED